MKQSFGTDLDLGDLGEQEVEVEFDYFPAERMTRDDPGCDAEVCITSVKWGKVELIDHLIEPAIEALEEQAFDHMRYQRAQAAEDRAEYLRDMDR